MMLVFPTDPGPGDIFERWQWDGRKWVPAGSAADWGDAPDDAVYGRSENEWRGLFPMEHVFSVRMVNNQDLAIGVWTTLNWDTVDRDTQGGWNNSTKRYTPKVAGWYFFSCVTPYIEHFMMVKNGTPGDHNSQIIATRAAGGWFHTGSTVTYMNGVTDYVLTATYNNAATITANPGAWRNNISAYRFPSW